MEKSGREKRGAEERGGWRELVEGVWSKGRMEVPTRPARPENIITHVRLFADHCSTVGRPCSTAHRPSSTTRQCGKALTYQNRSHDMTTTNIRKISKNISENISNKYHTKQQDNKNIKHIRYATYNHCRGRTRSQTAHTRAKSTTANPPIYLLRQSHDVVLGLRARCVSYNGRQLH